MRPRLVILNCAVLAVLLTATLSAAFPFSFWRTASAPVTYTQIYNAWDASTNTENIGDTTNTVYRGFNAFNDGTTRVLGKMQFKLTKVAGNISGKTFRCKIWTVATASVPGGATPVNALYILLATSAPVGGDNGWSLAAVDFVFSAPYTLNSGQPYAITLDMDNGSVDATNYAAAYFNSNGGFPAPLPANRALWRQDLSLFGQNSGFNVQARLFVTP